jgi:hypothetical protein
MSDFCYSIENTLRFLDVSVLGFVALLYWHEMSMVLLFLVCFEVIEFCLPVMMKHIL